METGLGLAFFPDLVHAEQAGSGAVRPTRFEAINRGWISITRPWRLATSDTGAGDPSAASAEKGQRLMELLAERLSQFLVELARAQMDESFPYTDSVSG